MKTGKRYYINVFIIYSIIGFIMETTLKYLFFKNMNNGFLYGPWIPIYGFGACIIVVIMRTVFNRIKANRLVKIILLFLISMISLTTLEFISGNLIEMLSGQIFWDYSDMKFNIGRYISLEIASIWGIMSLVLTYILKPISDKVIDRIPKIATYTIFILIIIDFSVSVLKELF